MTDEELSGTTPETGAIATADQASEDTVAVAAADEPAATQDGSATETAPQPATAGADQAPGESAAPETALAPEPVAVAAEESAAEIH